MSCCQSRKPSVTSTFSEGEDRKRSRDEERGKDQGEGTNGAWMRVLGPDGRLTKCSETEAKGLGGTDKYYSEVSSRPWIPYITSGKNLF